MKPALVVLAAGASTRLGRCKALVPLAGRTPLERLLAAGCGLPGPALVISGAHHARILAAAPEQVEVLENPNWRAGRSGGLALAQAARDGRDLLVAPVDCPRVPRALVEALVGEWLERGAPARGWLGPRHAGRHGHPIVLGRDLARTLRQLPPAASLRDLRGRADPLWALDTEFAESLDDLDTAQDLARIEAELQPRPGS